MKENYLAALLGCALGDALGMPVEGWKREQIRKYVGKITTPINPVVVKDKEGNIVKNDEFGKLKYWTKDLVKGQYTDDTILTLALAESIAEKGLDLQDAADRQLEAYLKKQNFGFGRTTKDAFANLQNKISPFESGVIGGPGNGPAMKMHPVGIYMHATGNCEQGLEFAVQVGRMTHLDTRSIASGVVQANAVYDLLNGIARDAFVDSLYNTVKKYEPPVSREFTCWEEGTLATRMAWIAGNKDASAEEAFDCLKNSGKAYESFPFALFMFQKYWNKPIEGLLDTINYGGDCDTTGAIYGALCGAKNGMIFPQQWLNELEGKEYITQLAEKMWRQK
jgi:ADP-ribosyl-[dinitrogen reductase] hydrolase